MLSVEISSCRRAAQRCPGRVDLPSRQVRGKGPQVCRRRCYRSIGRIHTDNTYERKWAQVTPTTPTLQQEVPGSMEIERKTFIQSLFRGMCYNFPKATGA